MNNINELIQRIKGLRKYKLVITVPYEESHLVLNALQKQMPLKPIDIKERHNFSGDVIYKDGYCPDCKNEISSSYRFCTLCGQKLDWSDKDE